MAKDFEMGYLLDFYGEVLTPKQREMLRQYYNDDLSLSEIGENFGITRQGARDAIKHGETALKELEEKLLSAADRRKSLEYKLFQQLRGALAEARPRILFMADMLAQLANEPFLRPEAATGVDRHIADADSAALRLLQQVDAAQQSGFTAAGRPQQCKKLALLDLQTQIRDDDVLSVLFQSMSDRNVVAHCLSSFPCFYPPKVPP